MRRRLGLIFAGPIAVAFLGACGMVTGLSDDFAFDGGEGGSTGDGGSGGDAGGGTDGSPTDGGRTDAKPDGAGRCSAAQSGQALLAMQGTGSQQCRDCLATNCCDSVNACHNDCGSRLQCDLDCTSKSTTGGRQSCMTQCANDKQSETFTQNQGVLSCSKQFCNEQCTFQ